MQNNTAGDILLIGHSTSGELSMMAYQDPDLAPRLKGRYLGWGSGGPARLELLRTVRGKEFANRAGASPPGGKAPLEELERRDPPSYARGYSGVPGSALRTRHVASADCREMAGCGRATPSQTSSSNSRIWSTAASPGQKALGGRSDRTLAEKRPAIPWRIKFEDVAKDLFATNFTRMDGFKRMVWTTAHF